MNDFTKVELEYLLSCPSVGCYDGLLNKIQAKIDNYCKHESDTYTYYKNGDRCTDFLTYASHDSPCFLKCKKCRIFYR